MKKVLYSFALLCAISSGITAQTKLPVMKSNQPWLYTREDNNPPQGNWRISPEWRPDVCKTSAKHITFISDCDSISFDIEKNGVYDFVVLLNGRDSAYTQVKWQTRNAFEDVPVEMAKLSSNGKMSRRQAQFDIDAMVYELSQVHPNMFTNCNLGDYFQAVAKVKNALPDSLTKVELYKYAAPLATLVGDGHTSMRFPFEIFNDTTKLLRMPMFLNVDSNDSTMTVRSCVDDKIPQGAKIISINGNGYKSIIENMMRYASGERYFFRLICVQDDNIALFQILYPANEYKVKYTYNGKTSETVLPAMTYNEYSQRMTKTAPQTRKDRYSFKILEGKNIAVMEFNSFRYADRMRAFSDSMFTVLKEKNISNLIIDIRKNGGGTSNVGDELFQYISPVPFQQFGKAIVRITPETQKLLGSSKSVVNWLYGGNDDEQQLIPLRENPLRYTGKVYLLISHYTFSAAGSFSWAFKHFHMGTIVGEESGGMNVCFGDALDYTLPISKLECRISFKRFWQYAADETDIHGTLPDYRVSADNALDYTIKTLIK